MVLQIVLAVVRVPCLNRSRNVQHVEYFSGEQAVTNTFLRRGEVHRRVPC